MKHGSGITTIFKTFFVLYAAGVPRGGEVPGSPSEPALGSHHQHSPHQGLDLGPKDSTKASCLGLVLAPKILGVDSLSIRFKHRSFLEKADLFFTSDSGFLKGSLERMEMEVSPRKVFDPEVLKQLWDFA